MRDGGLQGIQAVIQRQQGMPTEGDDDGLVLDGEHGGSRLLRPGRQVVDGAALPPLGDGLLVDAVAAGQGPQALLTMLDRSTDCRCRRGAAVQNLAHSASFHSREKTAPSNPGIKQSHLAENISFFG